MAPLTRILVASDLSGRAQRALARALRLAAEQQARVTVLHVLDGAGGEEAGPARQERIRDAEAVLQEQVRALIAAHRGEQPVEVAVRVVSGRDFVEIIRQGRAEAADLVVLGAHGEDALSDLLLGTTAERVVRKGDRPVLVVKRAPRGPYRRVLVPVDLSEPSRQALRFAAQLAGGAALEILHVCDVDLEYTLRRSGATEDEVERYRKQCVDSGRAALEQFVREAGPEIVAGRTEEAVRLVAEPGRPATVILDIARRRRIDLIVMGTHGRTGLPYLLLGSVAERVLREARCDVLAVRPEAFRFELP